MGKFDIVRQEVREMFFSRNPNQQEISDTHIDRCAQLGIKQFSRWKPRKNVSGVGTVVVGSSQILLPVDFMSSDVSTLLWVGTGTNQPSNVLSGTANVGVVSVFDSYLADTGYLPLLPNQYFSEGGLTGVVGASTQVSISLTTNNDGRFVIETGVIQTTATTRAMMYTAMHILTDSVYTVPEIYKDSYLLFVLHFIYKALANDSLMKTGSKRPQQYSQFWNTLANEALREAKRETSPIGFLS